MSNVTLTIDGRSIEVPAGTGLVEAAASAGIEIPVFCYEPRLGAPVGACRMCLVEVEGARGLQAACAMTATEGMVVSTQSDAARDAQESVLEFLLINHPLDCPVCDKGGECPLQDHAYRWGPGSSRFTELKRNNDKPIPISPLIALDRERCILCYRCTRFSSDVSGDNQLIARERGANAVIATFEGRPYSGHFSGNIIELCPVGALTSTEYRFKARPWEAPDHPTVCTLCPVGCNTYSTVREGKVVRMLARENGDVENGWLCDRGRFSYTSLYAEGRITRPYEQSGRGRPIGNRPRTDVSHEVAMEWLHERLSGTEAALWLLSGTETVEEAWAIQQLAGVTGGRVAAIEGASAAAPSSAATIAEISAARHIMVVGDADLADVAPILDLRVREAMREGAKVTVVGMGGSRLELAGAALEQVQAGAIESAVRAVADRVGSASEGSLTEPGIVIYRDGDLSADTLSHVASALGFPRDGSGFIAVAATANARGLAALGVETITSAQLAEHAGGLVLCSVDPSRHWDGDEWRPAVARMAWVAAISMFDNAGTQMADMVVPGLAYQERDGSSVNLEGRLQRLTMGAPAPDEIRSTLSWVAGLARRAGASVPGNAAGAFRALSSALPGVFPAATHGDIPEGGVAGVTTGVASHALQATHNPAAGELMLFVSPFLYDGEDVEHARSMEFLRDQHTITLARSDASQLGVSRGDHVTIEIDGRVHDAHVLTSRRIAAGHARMLASTAGLAPGRSGYRTARVSRAEDRQPAGQGA